MLQQKSLDLAHRHASGVHGDNLVVKARETPLVLRDKQRREAAVAVARHLDTHRAFPGEYRLGALAVALVGDIGGLGGTAGVAQVMVHLTAERTLDQGLLEGQ
ncbi:hypothetical protein D3C86_1969090 [compost metagenome]